MLSQFTRFVVVNNSGSTLTFNNNGRLNLKITRWIVDPVTGDIEYTQLTDDDFAFIAGDSVLDGAEEQTSEIDNTTNLAIGYQIQLEVTHDEGTAADGSFDLFVSGGDATGQLETDASGYDDAEINGLTFVGLLTWHASGLDDEVMRSPVLEVS